MKPSTRWPAILTVIGLGSALAVGLCACGGGDGTAAITTGTALGSDATTRADAPSNTPPVDGSARADAISTPLDAAGDGSTAQVKYPLCSEVLLCLGAACAGSSDPACGKPCLDGTSTANQEVLAPYLGCVQQACVAGLCAGSPDPACVSQCAGAKCFAKSLRCGADGKTGSKGCGGLLGCFDQCKDQGGACWYGCYGEGSVTAQQQFDQLMACATAAGGSDPFGACPAQMLTCAANGQQGNGSCADLWTCTSACEQLPEGQRFACYGSCWGQGSASAQQGWLAMVGCFTQPKPGCGVTVAACAGSTGQATCLATATCLGGCDNAATKDPACTVKCLQQAAPAEAAKTAELMACIGSQCAACKGQNPCQEQCIQSKCKAALNACLAP